MTRRNQKTTGEMISSVIFAGGGVVLLTGAADPTRATAEQVALALGGIGGLAAAGRFAIASLWLWWTTGRRQ